MFRRHHLLASLLLVAWTTAVGHAQTHLTVNIVDGRVSLLAQNVSLRAILREWTNANGTTFVNADRLPDTLVSLQLTNLPQREALATLLRGVSGYVVGQGAGGPDRIVILPQSAPVNNLAQSSDPSSDPVLQPQQPSLAEISPDVPPMAGPGRGSEPLNRAGGEPMAAGVAGTSAAVSPKSVPFVRINSSDAITDVVNGVNPETLLPPAMRAETPLLVTPPDTRTGTPGGVTTLGPAPAGVVYFRPTDPSAVQGRSGGPTATAPRK
jgi:hypothetical protein